MSRVNIEVVNCEDWDGLCYIINSSFADWPDYVFRGHADSEWLLEPTLNRILKKIKYENKQEIMQEHLDRFKLEIRGRRGINPKDLKDDELWALGQHFGLHTPLLDWTRSPYVALFFALTDNKKPKSGYRTLWALHLPDVNEMSEYYKKLDGNNTQEVMVINPMTDDNSRLINQNGLFTKLNIGQDIENWVANANPPDMDWITLYKINFSNSIKSEALSYLNLMNVNYSSIYPDLVGSSFHCNVILSQKDYIEKEQNKLWRQSKHK